MRSILCVFLTVGFCLLGDTPRSCAADHHPHVTEPDAPPTGLQRLAENPALLREICSFLPWKDFLNLRLVNKKDFCTHAEHSDSSVRLTKAFWLAVVTGFMPDSGYISSLSREDFLRLPPLAFTRFQKSLRPIKRLILGSYEWISLVGRHEQQARLIPLYDSVLSSILDSCPYLTTLTFKGSNIQLPNLGDWSKRSPLQSLTLDYAPTDTDLEAICACPNLKMLSLVDAHDLTDSGFSWLKGLQHLEELRLAQCIKMTEATFPHLEALTNLHTLAIIESPYGIRGDSLFSMPKLPKLQSLGQVNCDEDPSGRNALSCLKDCLTLQRLTLTWRRKITAQDIDLISQTPQLKDLVFLGKHGITVELSEQLKRLMPQCSVFAIIRPNAP